MSLKLFKFEQINFNEFPNVFTIHKFANFQNENTQRQMAINPTRNRSLKTIPTPKYRITTFFIGQQTHTYETTSSQKNLTCSLKNIKT